MFEKLKNIIDAEKINTNVPMSEYTTFRTGGNADIMVSPTTVEEVKALIKFFYEEGTEYYVLGNGSNILVNDKGIRRPIIHLGRNFSSIEIFENCITAKSGAFLSAIARKAADNSLTGFEFAAGIPGTLGGALIMNAGAYGGEMKDVVEAVSFIDNTGNEYVVTCEEMEFGYRTSALADTDCIITGATIKLTPGEKDEINEKMSELAEKRRAKQPLEFPSAGSTFKRPAKEGVYAGALIETAGLKGMRIGGAQVSEKHAGFIVNIGDATTDNVYELIKIVQEKVFTKHGYLLETEVKYWE